MNQNTKDWIKLVALLIGSGVSAVVILAKWLLTVMH